MIPFSDLPYVEWTEPDTGEVKRLYPDTQMAEGLTLPAVVTEHAVETGSKITDHYRKDNETATIKMYFSSVPLRGDLDDDNPGASRHFPFNFPKYPPGAPIFTPGGATQALTGAIGSLFGGDQKPTGYEALAFDSDPGKRFVAAIELVRRFQTEGILATFNTTMGRIENVAILNGQPSREDDGSDGGVLELDAKQVRFVTSDIATAAPLPTEPRGQKKGSNSANGADSLGSGNDASVAKKALNGFGVTTAGSGQ